jgi:dihydrolipoamide dehydrogenase
VCLNEGCIPTKSLLDSAKIYDSARHGDKYGVTAGGIAIDHAAVVKRKDKVVRTLVAGVKGQLKATGVTVVTAEAKLVKAGGGVAVQAGGETYEAKDIILATGSSALVPPIPGAREALESGFLLTNREILALTAPPRRLVVIGGGVIGLEMASYFRSIGCEVTVVEMLDKIGGPLDRELSALLLKNYEKKGVAFELGAKVTRVTDSAIFCEREGQAYELLADNALLSVGRAANVEGLGLDDAGVEYDHSGIKTDARLSTNVPHVYAIGDCGGKLMLAHTAYREGDVCVACLCGEEDAVNYTTIPSVIYTNPEAAWVGESLASARDKGFDCEEHTVSMRFSGRYIAENEGGDGVAKLVTDRANRALLGVHLLGNYSSEIIYGAGMMIESKTPVSDLRKIVFPHPSVAEIIREALLEIDV